MKAQQNFRASRLSGFFLLAMMIGMTGCSSGHRNSESGGHTQTKTEVPAGKPEDIRKSAVEAFANAPGLTSDQKQKLAEIYSKTASEGAAIRIEIGQSKSLLFKTVANKAYKSAEVEKIRQKIVDLDQKRLKVMFKALEDVQKVIGYGQDKEEIYEKLREYESIPGRILSAD